MSKNRIFLLIVIIAVFMSMALSGSMFVKSVLAAPEAVVVGPMADLTYVGPPTNMYFDGDDAFALPLFLQYDTPSSTPTSFGYLKFDLSGMTPPIEQVRLYVGALGPADSGCYVTTDNLTIGIFGISSIALGGDLIWDETTNRPLAPMVPDTALLGTIGPIGSTGYFYYEEVTPGALVAFLQNEFNTNPFQQATIRLEALDAGTPPNPVTGQMMLEDTEGTIASNPCPPITNSVANGWALLEGGSTTDPLAISLEVFEADTNPFANIFFWGIVTLLACGLFISLLIYRRRIQSR